MFSIYFPYYRPVYEIMWKNMVNLDRPQMTIWRMRIACWITKTTDPLSEYVLLLHGSNGYGKPLSVTLPVMLSIKM